MANKLVVSPSWDESNIIPDLDQLTLDIWRISLSLGDQTDLLVLSEFEQVLASMIVHLSDRQQWIRCRSAVRKILSQYLGIDPNEIVFRTSVHGKPEIEIPDQLPNKGTGASFNSRNPIRFNVSHTKGMALIAVTAGNLVGIDIEFIEKTFNPLDIAATVFAPDEIAFLTSCDEHCRIKRFYELWTRKESWLKMVGCGLVDNMSSFSILQPAKLHKLLRPHRIVQLELSPDYTAAVSVKRPIAYIRKFDFK